ncbi:MAG: hypothetical protein ACXQT5_05575 [Candidatus Syntropharchaeia archaeon]
MIYQTFLIWLKKFHESEKCLDYFQALFEEMDGLFFLNFVYTIKSSKESLETIDLYKL